MKQYCRYCANCVGDVDGLAFCMEDMSEVAEKSVYRCKRFVFDIDALGGDLDKKYKPRGKKEKVEDTSPTLFD